MLVVFGHFLILVAPNVFAVYTKLNGVVRGRMFLNIIVMDTHSIPFFNRFENGSPTLRCRKDSQMETRPNKFFSVHMWANHISSR